MNENDWIVVTGGDVCEDLENIVFEGTRDNFRDCFFDNANDENIENWCKMNSFSLTITHT